MHIILLILVVNSGKPCMKDLQSSITLKYATQWMVIGTQLGIDYGFLQINGKNFPSDVSRCCNEMLQRWLQSDCNTTWDKIWEAVKSPTVSKARHQNNSKWLYNFICMCEKRQAIKLKFAIHLFKNFRS